MPDIFIAKKNKSNTSREDAQIQKKKIHIGRFLKRKLKTSEKISFTNQKENEEIILFLRGHIIRNLSWILIAVLLIFLPLILFKFDFFTGYFAFLSQKHIVILLLLYYLILLGYILVNIMNWFYNILIITNLGVVDIDYSNILYHDVAFTKLTLIEDVNYTKTGFIRSLFNFGDLFIQTAGGRENIEAIGIPDPAKAAHIIADSIGKGEGSG